jgi:hypothetical protein
MLRNTIENNNKKPEINILFAAIIIDIPTFTYLK